MSSKNMINNRKVLISNLPNGVTSNVSMLYFMMHVVAVYSVVFDGSCRSVSDHLRLATAGQFCQVLQQI